MKKVISLLCLIFSFLHFVNSQNLVPNPSFENIISCPISPIQIWLAPPWFQPNFFSGINNSSSDLFNSCCTSSSLVGVPVNILGYQNPRTGIGYAGFYSYNDTVNMREYIEVPLIDTLIANKNYCVEFYVSISNFCYNAISNVGAYFSVDTVFQNNIQFYALSSYIPQIENPITNMLNDTANWMLVSGNFIATGGERFMTIGNFRIPANTNTQIMPGATQGGAYYYIDDVSVVDCTGDGVDELTNNSSIKLYPNPNSGMMLLEYKLQDNQSGIINITDVTGKQIRSYAFNNSGTSTQIDARELEAGVYFYDVLINNTKVKTDKLIIIKQ